MHSHVLHYVDGAPFRVLDVCYCWLAISAASLCNCICFVSLDQCIGDPNFLAGLCWGACSPALASCVLLWSRESVPLARVCTVLLVSSLYRKLVLLFLIYILLTFDQKKKERVVERKLFPPSIMAAYCTRPFL
jgi:hypothetical protein